MRKLPVATTTRNTTAVGDGSSGTFPAKLRGAVLCPGNAGYDKARSVLGHADRPSTRTRRAVLGRF